MPPGVLKLHALWPMLAADVARRPLGTGPLWPQLSDRSWYALAASVDVLRRHYPATWGLFGTEDEARVAVVDVFEERGPCADAVLVHALRALAKQQWLIEAPIVNVARPSGLVIINPSTIIAATDDRARGNGGWPARTLVPMSSASASVRFMTRSSLRPTPATPPRSWRLAAGCVRQPTKR